MTECASLSILNWRTTDLRMLGVIKRAPRFAPLTLAIGLQASAGFANPADSGAEGTLDPLPSFEWRAPAECPSRPQILDRAAQLAGAALRQSASPDVRILATIEVSERGRWRLHYVAAGPSSVRTMEGGGCEELADAAALLLALQFAPDAARLVQGSPTSPVLSQSRLPLVPSSDDSNRNEMGWYRFGPTPGAPGLTLHGIVQPVTSPFLRWSRVRLRVGMKAAMLSGRLPRPAPGLIFISGLRNDDWFVDLRASWFPPQQDRLSNDDASTELWLVGLGPTFGRRWQFGKLTLVPEFAIDIELLRGYRKDGVGAHAGTVALLGLGAGLSTELRVSSSISLLASGQASGLMTRPGFTLGSDVLHRADAVGFKVGIGAVWETKVAD